VRYNREADKSHPRLRQVPALGTVRGMGKSEVQEKLKERGKSIAP